MMTADMNKNNSFVINQKINGYPVTQIDRNRVKLIQIATERV